MNRQCFSTAVLAILMATISSTGAQSQQLAPNPDQSDEALKLYCWNVKKSGWGPCIGGSIPRRLVLVGIGGRFVEIDPDSKIAASGVYRNCNELAQDSTLPKTFREKAKQTCNRLFAPNQNSTTKESSQ